jgi:hypothetical protein
VTGHALSGKELGYNLLTIKRQVKFHLFALLGAHHILHVSKIRVKISNPMALKANAKQGLTIKSFTHLVCRQLVEIFEWWLGLS